MNNNKLIAEFMGDTFYPEPQHWYDSHGSFIGDALKYHNSWDWLMPVVQKCFEVAENEDDFFDISGNLPYMDETYKSVVEFIKTYNDMQTLREDAQFINTRNYGSTRTS